MGKPRQIEATVLAAIRERWSTRSFRNEKIPYEVIHRIFEAARWSPSAFNLQPWRFIIGEQGDETYNNILDTLADANRIWSSDAPLLIVCLSDTLNDKSGTTNMYHAYDSGQCVAQLTIQAVSEGLCVHSMGGFDQEKCRKAFSVPDRYAPQTVIAIGFPGDPALLPERLRELEKTESVRIPLKNILFKESFGTKTDIFEPLG